MPLFDGLLCGKCGKPVLSLVPECRECEGKRFYVKNLRSVGRYDGNLKQVILSLKYSSAFKAADYLGKKMARLDIDCQGENDLIISFIPIKRTKQAFRGYNQAELLARSLAKQLNLPVVRLLVKVKHTRDQSGLTKTERKQNLRDAFLCTNSRKVEGKTIILVDDVYTSGNTMNEAARTLLCSGASEIIGLTAARTLSHL